MKKIHQLKHLVLLSTALLFTIVSCDGPDAIYITNQSPMEVGLLVDGADASGDFIDRTILTSATNYEFSEDIIPRSDGLGEIVAFNEGHPPFARNPISWREGKDLASIPFEDEIALNFTVWIVDVNINNTVNNRTNETIDALAYADERWLMERVGLKVGDIRFVDATGDSDANDLRDCEPCNSTYFDNLKNDIGFDAGRINIYLVRSAGPSWGRYYGRVNDIGGDQIIMGMFTGSEDLLLHEIAHNFFLEHVDDDDTNFDNKNVATSIGGSFNKRKYFTEGQTFRVHFHENSAINDTYNVRPGLYTTTCIHQNNSTITCPAVQKRIWSDDSNWPAN